MQQLLVVDDDRAVRESVERALRFEGYDVATANDGQAALAAIAADPPALVVLDLMMPRLSGLEVCRRLRAQGDRTPVLVLTAKDDVGDRVAGLDAGADDYLVKPFALEELLARVRALLRRTAPPKDTVLTCADLTLDPATRDVRRGERLVELTRTEFALLEVLLEHPRQVLSRRALFEHVWGYDLSGSSNGLDVYVGYLRRKLEAEGEPRLLHTVRGVGYVVREPRDG